jgi:hypothetical protein
MDRKELLGIKNDLETLTKRVKKALDKNENENPVPVDASGNPFVIGKKYVHVNSGITRTVVGTRDGQITTIISGDKMKRGYLDIDHHLLQPVPLDAAGEPIEIGKIYYHLFSSYIQKVDEIIYDYEGTGKVCIKTTKADDKSRLTSDPFNLCPISNKELPYFSAEEVWHKEFGELKVEYPEFCLTDKAWKLVCTNSKGVIVYFWFEDLSLSPIRISLENCVPGDIYELQDSGGFCTIGSVKTGLFLPEIRTLEISLWRLERRGSTSSVRGLETFPI